MAAGGGLERDMTIAVERPERIVIDPVCGGRYDFDRCRVADLEVRLFRADGSLPEQPLDYGAHWIATPAVRATGGTLTMLSDVGAYDRLRISRRRTAARPLPELLGPTVLDFMGHAELRAKIRGFTSTGADATAITGAIQDAINWRFLNGGGPVLAPGGRYVLNATLTTYDKVPVVGERAGEITTIFQRDSVYGDTLKQTGGWARVENIYFRHGADHVAGAASLNHRLTNGAAHLRLLDCANVKVQDCLFHRMPYGIVLDGCHNVDVERSRFRLTYDPQVVLLQEGIADIWLAHTNRYCQVVNLTRNRFTGCFDVARDITFTDAALNTITVSRIPNIGARHNLLISSCEVLHAHGNYFGRAASSLVRYEMDRPTAERLCMNHDFDGNFFDNAGNATGEDAQIDVYAAVADAYLFNLTIGGGNRFNGQEDTLHGLNVRASIDNKPSVYTLSLGGATFVAHVGAPLRLNGVKGFTVTGPVITGYNRLGFSLPGSDAAFSAGILVGLLAEQGAITSAVIGGNGNIHAASPAHAHYGIFFLNTSASVERTGNRIAVSTQADNHAWLRNG